MHGWRCDAEVSLHISLGGRRSVDLRMGMGMNECQVLALLFGEPGGTRGWRGAAV